MAKKKKDEQVTGEEYSAPEEISAPAEEVVVEAPAAPAPVKLKAYRLKERHMVSIGGMITHLEKGQVIDASSHGHDVIEKLKGSGAPLEEV